MHILEVDIITNNATTTYALFSVEDKDVRKATALCKKCNGPYRTYYVRKLESFTKEKLMEEAAN